MRNLKDSYVIDRFVAHLKKKGHPDLKVDRRPDEENQNSPDIDAIAGSFAIEHTSIDTLPDQRRNNDWFMQVIDGLEQELPSQPSFSLRITLEYGAVTTQQNWKAIRQALKSWIIKDAPHLAEGQHVLDSIPGIPFKLHVNKEIDSPLGVRFGRFAPNDNTLADRIKTQCDRKAKKLRNIRDLER